MKNLITFLLVAVFLSLPSTIRAEDTLADAPAPTLAVEPASAVTAVQETPLNTENLEFISGEISALDESSSSLTVKLYGETEDSGGDKTLKVAVDANTDITDGEQDRELKSLTVGTEVDVEYDPSNNKATYIFVY